MCIICKGEDLTGLKYLNVYDCQNITEIPNIEGIKELCCWNTNITKIPYIKGLKILHCFNTNITEIPHIKGLKELMCGNTKITEIQHIEGLKKLGCRSTNITEIPHIEGLKYLDCSHTNITEIPNIEGCKIYSHKCKWLTPPQERLDKVIRLQKWFRRYLLSNKIINIIPEITKIYFIPGMKGYMLNKKKFDLFIG